MSFTIYYTLPPPVDTNLHKGNPQCDLYVCVWGGGGGGGGEGDLMHAT